MGQLMDWYNQNAGLAGTTGMVGGILQGIGNYGLQQQMAQNQYAQQAYWPAYTTTTTTNISLADFEDHLKAANQKIAKSVKKVAQKTGKFLVDLRREIDDWHGDILMRAA